MQSFQNNPSSYNIFKIYDSNGTKPEIRLRLGFRYFLKYETSYWFQIILTANDAQKVGI